MTGTRLLILVDDSPASRRAVAYVASMVGGQRRLRFYLAHPMAPLPAHLLEFRGASNPSEEERLDVQLKDRQNRWTSAAQDAAQRVFARAQATLRRAGVVPSAVKTEFFTPGSGRQAADGIFKLARAKRCNTVVVGRRSVPWLRKLLNTELAEELVRRGTGFTIWVVE
jgi:nucleotide-binding universal stress UspA family protein